MKLMTRLAMAIVAAGTLLQSGCGLQWIGDLLGDLLWLRGID